MIERSVTIDEIETAVINGIIIKEYPEDKPYPSILLCYKNEQKTLHVVYSMLMDTQGNQTCHIITLYEPNVIEWNENFTQRRDTK